MIEAIDHIGIAVRSLETAVPRYEQVLGVACSRVEIVASQGVRTAFFDVGNSRIELLEPTSEESPIARFIAKRGEGLHHIALRSSSLTTDLDGAVKAGCEHLTSVPSEGAHGVRVAFLHPRDICGVLIELCGAGDTADTVVPPSPKDGGKSAPEVD